MLANCEKKHLKLVEYIELITVDGLAFKVDWQLLTRCLHMDTCLPRKKT